jgi:hypothetical protein
MGDASFDQHGDGEDRMTLSLFTDSTQHPWRNHSNLGLLHRQMGQFELAVFWFEKALESEPNSQVVRVALAQTLENMGRSGDAVYHLKHVAAAQGRDVQRWILDSLKRLLPPDRHEEPEPETSKSRSASSAVRSSSASKTQLSQPSSRVRKEVSMRRMTMVDKIATGAHFAHCFFAFLFVHCFFAFLFVYCFFAFLFVYCFFAFFFSSLFS